MLWACNKGHKWKTCLNEIRNKKHWCPVCARNKKLTIEICNKIAATHCGDCLSNKYINAKTRMKWKCAKGHTWFAVADKIINRGDWCHKCAYKNMSQTMLLKDGIVLAKIISEKHNGKCLSKMYLGNNKKLIFVCNNGHKFKSTLTHIKDHGRWCPQCSFGKTQNKITAIIRELLNTDILTKFKDFAWLKTKNNGKLELDIFVPKYKLAIEYDGEQHFMPVCFGGISEKKAKHNFETQKIRDESKNKKIRRHKNDIKYFIRIGYKDKDIITKEYIIKKLKKVGLIINERIKLQ